MKKMSKKSISLVLIFTMLFLVFMPSIVRAEPGVGRVDTAVITNDELKKETTVYAGEVVVDGVSQIQWLYSSDISNTPTVFDNLKSNLNGTVFGDLVPTITEETEEVGLAVSSVHQSDMNASWTSASYVANQFYTGTLGTESNANLYDANTAYKNNIDTAYATHQEDVDDSLDFSKRILSVVSTYVESDLKMLNGSLTRVDTITLGLEATTVNYTKVDVTTNSVDTPITNANITLTAPKIGDKVEKITKDDGYGEYETQSAQPSVTTTTEGLDIYAYWVVGLEQLSEEPFYGTFEADTYYYAMIDFEAEEGYELPATFPDGIKINGQAPDEVFAVMGGKWNHCIAKIKATSAEAASDTYEFIDDTANQTYTINEDDALTFRINADYSLFENGGKVFVDGTETTEYTSESGSTVISLNKDFVDSLSVGEHTLKVAFNNGGESTTKFTIEKTEETTSNSPKAGDNVIFLISLMVVSIIGLARTVKFVNKRK